jgi:collagenase-like PrtC family protease
MTSKYGAYALCVGLARLYARMRMNTPTRPDTHIHARTRKHAHTDQYVILNAFPQQQWFRERASMICYTYIACLVTYYS